MEKVEDIQSKDFKKEINNKKPVVIEFWIKSCGNCKKFKPVYKELSNNFSEKLRFTRMNMFESIENLKLAENLGTEETPTLKFFYKNQEIGEIIGFKTLEEATQEINMIIENSGC
jgi:thiol-disulfide isomerase/thioredoxin